MHPAISHQPVVAVAVGLGGVGRAGAGPGPGREVFLCKSVWQLCKANSMLISRLCCGSKYDLYVVLTATMLSCYQCAFFFFCVTSVLELSLHSDNTLLILTCQH